MIKKKIEQIFIILITFFYGGLANAGTGPLTDYEEIRNQTDAIRGSAGFDSTTRIGTVVGSAIQAFLGLLGIIFVILIVLAGYNWMTAGGEEEKVNKAKDGIRRAIIGIIVIIAAYAISFFVFSHIAGVDTGPTP